MSMDTITLNLIVLCALALIGGGIFWLVWRARSEDEQKILQFASEQGWKYESIREPLAWGMRLVSSKWTLESVSRSSGQESGSGSSDVSMSSTWRADAPGSSLLIGPRTSQVNLGGFGDMLARQVLQLALGADSVGLVEIHCGSGNFREKYMIWAQDPLEAEKLVTPGLEAALLAYKREKPLIKRTSGGLSIELRGVRLQKVDALRALIEVGEMFL
jgi:hypothetical protein